MSRCVAALIELASMALFIAGLVLAVTVPLLWCIVLPVIGLLWTMGWLQ